jgi:hypothetical protein
MGSFNMKNQSEQIREPYQTPIAIQMTTTVLATSDSIRLSRFTVLNKKIIERAGGEECKPVHTQKN